MSAMDVSSVDTDDNSNDQLEENLLEPLTEASSLTERQKTITMSSTIKSTPSATTSSTSTSSSIITTTTTTSSSKTTDNKDPSSLPDSRAKMLHLQRIARSGDSSSNDTVNSTSSSRRHKSQSIGGDTEKEETVSFSLESIIRRGLNEQKIKSNFNSNFKFGKPDDNISLRCNPSANLFYEPKNESGTESSDISDAYESSGERENTENTPIAAMNNCIAENGGQIDIDEPVRRKRGRPKMTDEQRAQKDALRLQNSNTIEPSVSSSSHPTQVDELMAMGHSMFSGISRKRGRPKKNRDYLVEKLNRTAPAGINQIKHTTAGPSNHDDTITSPYKNNSMDLLMWTKKRGRPKKDRGMIDKNQTSISQADNDSIDDKQLNVENASKTLSLTAGPIRRGRKPKQIQDFYVKLERPSTPVQNVQQENNIVEEAEIQTGPRKRGRPKKNRDLSANKNLNRTAPAALNRSTLNDSTNQDGIIFGNNSIDMLIWAKKRGRKPKVYYEQLAALDQNSTVTSNSSTLIQSAASQKPSVSFSGNISFDEPPAKKKRGRPKKDQSLTLQHQLASSPAHQNQSPILPINNQSTPINRSEEKPSSHASPANTPILPKKRGPKPGSRQNRKTYVRLIHPSQRGPIRRPSVKLPATGFPIKKKRGRKPKNWNQPEMNLQNGPVENNEYKDQQQKSQYPIDEGASSSRAPDQVAMKNDRIATHGYLFDVIQQKCDEIRKLKQRLSNVLPGEERMNWDQHESMPWTIAELCKAYAFQRRNIPLLEALRDQFSLPLPAMEEQREFIRKLKLECGLQSKVLQIMGYERQLYQEHETKTILQISYVKTSNVFEYDDTLDRVWGHEKMFCIITARGLYDDWQHMVYFNHNMRITKAILLNVIEALHKHRFDVVAVSSNFQEGKSDIFTEMSVGYGKNFFLHPCTPDKIYCFYYLADVLKAVNTHLCMGRLQIEEKKKNLSNASTPSEVDASNASNDSTNITLNDSTVPVQIVNASVPGAKEIRERIPLNKQTILLAIQNSYRRMAIPREILAWTDSSIRDINFLESFYADITLIMLQLTLNPSDPATIAIIEFFNIIKTYTDVMSRSRMYEADVDVPNFDLYIECQNKKLGRFIDRIFKLICLGLPAEQRRFRDAMLMSTVSLTMLRKTVLGRYQYASFSTKAITEEFVRVRLGQISTKNNYPREMSPMRMFHLLKSIFFGYEYYVKTETKDKFFYKSAVTAAEVNGRNEAYYASALHQWLTDQYVRQHPNSVDVKEIKRKLKKMEEYFCRIQNPDFHIVDNVSIELTNQLRNVIGADDTFDEFIQTYVIQRLLLRTEYFKQNRINRIPNSGVQVSIDLD